MLIKNSHQGFTLIEVLVVMTILIFIAGFALFVSMDSYRGYSFRSERDTLVSILQKARSQAISNICLGSGCTDGKPHGVYFDVISPADHCYNQYVIFQGSVFVDGDAQNQCVPINNKVSFAFTPPAQNYIVFNQLDGSTAGVTITITQGTNHAIIQINAEGQIDNP